MKVHDLDACASLFRVIRTPDAKAVASYEMVSDAMIWSDELPKSEPSLWWAIRPVLRHRAAVATGEHSDYLEWWTRALELFPEWTGFRADRCVWSASVLEKYRVAREKSQAEIERYFSQ